MQQFPFKSYCWVVGTTSFRTMDFNVRIERQLELLNEFWAIPEHAGKAWQDLQDEYYSFIQAREFVKGDAPAPEKDARQKTSGLADIGLLDRERKLTEAGTSLLRLAEIGVFESDNPLKIATDSYIYLKQLLKTSNKIDGHVIRPFVITAYALLRLGHLTDEEFSYLLPLCTSPENTEAILTAITRLRDGEGCIDEIILSRLLSMDNYQAALDCFLANPVTENLITAIGMNRKSRTYDRRYYFFYELLYKVVIERHAASVLPLFEQSRKIGSQWQQYLFGKTNKHTVEQNGLAALNDVPLLRATTEAEFKRRFFEQLHLFKARATLADYADLNRRYFKTTDAVVFADNKVELDVLPRCWLHAITDDLLSIAFEPSDRLTEDVDLATIAPFLEIDERQLAANLERFYGVTVTTAEDIKQVVQDARYRRLHALIDKRFDTATLIDLFDKFERRQRPGDKYDNAIRKLVTNNANAPTIFEYILGIAWYIISGRQGDVLDAMNLSLEADLLPRSHAKGGNADIVYKYGASAAYPAHALLLEATLTEETNQRRAEIEPVSRHLGDYLLKNKDTEAYCVFVSTVLHRNTISDFRNRKTYEHYSKGFKDVVQGLKILPLATSEVQTILAQGIHYDDLYPLFERAYRSEEPIPTWYEQELIAALAP